MLKKLLLIVQVLLFTISIGFAQTNIYNAETNVAGKKDQKEGWTKVIGLGADFSSLSLLNPRFGAGNPATGFGGALSADWDYKKGKVLWNTNGQILLRVQKNGDLPFVKAADLVGFISQAGYSVSENNKWYVTGKLRLLTQLLSTYGSGSLKESTTDTLVSGLFSPATVDIVPGILYTPNAHWKHTLTPAGIRMIIVSNDVLASTGKLGNPWTSAADFDNTRFQVGLGYTGQYTNKFLKDRITWTAMLDLFSNYLNNPQNLDVWFSNNLDVAIAKGLSLNWNLQSFYDHDIPVQVGGDPNKTGLRPFSVSAIMLKYAKTF